MKSIRAILLVSIALLATSSTEAQVVREEGVKPIAGVLGGGYPTETLWIIKSSGNENHICEPGRRDPQDGGAAWGGRIPYAAGYRRNRWPRKRWRLQR